ncbi:DNA damage-binding protein 1-like protein [Basidiobolus meristosporus CBS 931.73]|uniref:DNA damage-binding protein 1 n=1 Tax=Basidiobolus meristosporus CBS 931.73 TaxID=1314790 RepID=A0A1Y1Y0A7_9FUNG|nr:DNA damage-binding protein 1-like protein [Basidiobolus meristosporus CBS 931.73]|eukprot:ORX91440.1 DNA damage-binding protein 1-like protein [Basidiobolus meristosporus CBS 931.73]
MAYNYVVTAQKSTSIQNAVKGNFTGPDHTNLIVSKGTRVEIYLLSPEGLRPFMEFGVYGRIATLKLYRPPGRDTDLLFVSTEKYKFFVLSYDHDAGVVNTEANGDLKDLTGKPCESGQIGLIDPECRLIGMHLYQGLLKVIPIESDHYGKQTGGTRSSSRGKEPLKPAKVGDLRDAFNIRLEELLIVSMTFLHGMAKPTLAVLYQDTKEARHIKTYEVSIKDKEFLEGPWSVSNVEPGANILIGVPAPLGGVIAIGEQTITHYTGKATKSISMNTTVIKAYGQIDSDGSRYLLGDYLGNLYVLVLLTNGSTLTDLKLERLGETSSASCIVYLDNGYTFVGSHFGDSQLVRLGTDPNENGDFLEIVDRFTNLAPIADFCVVDLERQGQGQIVTCSGAYKDGSLRIIRNGVGINEQAFLEMSGIKGIWSLRPAVDASHENMLVISFIGETRILALDGEEMEEVEDTAGFVTDEMTIAAANVSGGVVAQVTESSINLIDVESNTCTSKWTPDVGSKINVACINPSQIVVALGGGILVYFEIRESKLLEINRCQLEHEIACLDINPLDPASPTASSICAVGLWTDISVKLLRLPTLEPLNKQFLGGEIIPRSVLMASFEGINYLLIALGDGHLFNFVLDVATGELTDRKKITLGTQPIVFSTFKSNGTTHVFAASDRPTVIYSSNQKLSYSNVNLKEVTSVCPFHSSSFPNSLALTSDEGLTIGTIDEIQKLHIRTVPLGEMARRITHQESTRTFGVLTMKLSVDPLSGEEDQTSYFKLFDDQTFEVLDSFQMDTHESVQCITSVTFEQDPNVYYAVGTAYALPDQDEPKAGKILIFQVLDTRQIKLVSDIEVKGCVYSIVPFAGKLLAGINNKVSLFEWSLNDSESGALNHVHSHEGHVLALYIVTRGDFIIVGDLMRSISLLAYKQLDDTIEEISKDYNSNWMSAVEALDDDLYIGSEIGFNLFTVRKNAEATTDEERRRLETVGQFHLGEFVNKFRHGSLVMNQPDNETPAISSLLFGTANGSIGVVASLPQDQYNFLLQVQSNLTKVIHGVGGLDHQEWRAFQNERKTVACHGFLDGDLIECFLDLKKERMEDVVTGIDGGAPLKTTVEELTKIIEGLARIH